MTQTNLTKEQIKTLAIALLTSEDVGLNRTVEDGSDEKVLLSKAISLYEKAEPTESDWEALKYEAEKLVLNPVADAVSNLASAGKTSSTSIAASALRDAARHVRSANEKMAERLIQKIFSENLG